MPGAEISPKPEARSRQSAISFVPWIVSITDRPAALQVERLGPDYPSNRAVIVYRGGAIEPPRIRRITLRELAEVPLAAEEAVVAPPAVTLQPNRAMLGGLQALDARGREAAAA